MSLRHFALRSAMPALFFGATAAQAMSFGIYDPRSLAMGGVGVSSGTSENASYLNPALLAPSRKKEKFSIEIPTVAIRVADPNKLRDDVDKMDKAGNDLDNALQSFNNATTPAQRQATAGQVATALGGMRSALSTVSNKGFEIGGFVAPLTLGVPGDTLGVGLHYAARADASARFLYASGDDAVLASFQNAASTFSGSGSLTDLATLIASFGNVSTGTLNDPQFQSRFDMRGIVLTDMGIALAHKFEGAGGFSVGVTPKWVSANTFDYSVTPQHTEISRDQGRKDYGRNFNLDLGVLKDIGTGFRVGLTGKNLLSRTYVTALNNKLDVKPQFRAGVSHHTGWTTVALDVDVTKNDALTFDKPSQFAALGGELDLFGWLQLRAGYRSDLTKNYSGVGSFGLGINIIGLHIDAGVARRGLDEVMGSVQLGFRY